MVLGLVLGLIVGLDRWVGSLGAVRMFQAPGNPALGVDGVMRLWPLLVSILARV
ncbi:hypothetical protein AAFM46_09675 [Arthrobacter sp. TMP15]|uniref:hypothetical protein n=1 Tax=Arthrobacter sp. TMP15 TaxID=3140789 RepID=UPI0031BBA43B